jgi:hypothetical protein
MPHFWIQIPGNPKPPKEIREETRRTVDEQEGAELLGGEVFFHPRKPNRGYATVECTDRQIEEIQRKLNCQHERVFTAEEAEEADLWDDSWDGGYDGASSSSA